jgi:PAS domain S-box-containing protein
MKHAEVESPTMLPGDSLVPLESILCTEELNRRPSRAPDYQADKCALVALAQALADSPRTILQTMAEMMLEVFQCDSAGFSLLTKDGKNFYWPAIAGMWQPHIGGGTPRNFGPCGDVLDCNRPLLFSHWEQRYPYLLAAMPLAEEGLLVPFYVQGKAVGTIWAIAHNDRRKFDAEDMRQLVSLGSFASSAYQVLAFLDALEERDEALRQSCEGLEQRVVERTSQLTAVNEELRKEILERKRAEKERKRADQELRESEKRYRYIFQATGVSIWEEDFSQVKTAIDDVKARGLVDFRKYLAENPEFVARAIKMVRIVDVNEATVRLFGAESKEQLLFSLDKVFTPETEQTFAEELIAIAEGQTYFEAETIVQTLKGGKLTVLFTITFPPELAKLDSVLVSIMDITERKRGETLFAGEKRLLEMIATGVALKEILDVLCQIIEEYRSGTLASVLLLRSDGLHLDSVAGPSLPKAWTQQLEKLPIGPCVGSCGTAAYRGSRVIVSDIATDPLWEVPEHRAAALRHGLRASWSNPILASDGKVLGTFCIYNRETRSPNPHDLGLIEKATDLARVAIERDRAEASLRTSEEKYRDLINASPDAICVIDADRKCVLVNPAGVDLAGRSEDELIGSSIADTYLPEERHLLEHRIDKLKAEGSLRFERKFVRKNGEVIPVEVSLSALRGRYYQAIIRDISQRKRAEEALRTSEQLARSHVDVMMRSLDVLATEAAPEKFIAEMLRTIAQRLHARSVLLWLRHPDDDLLHLRLAIDDGQQVPPLVDHPFVKDPQAWKRNLPFQEMFLTKGPVVCDDVEHDLRFGAELRDYMRSKGRKRFLAIPMFMLGEVRGFIGIQHTEERAYRPEEIELAQALAHHVMIATHEAELGEQRRHAVLLQERTRMARDIHDTLAQGFTGVIIQLDTAVEALRDEEPEAAAKHIRRARDLARDSLTEARRSVHALRPQALEKAAFADALRAIITNTTAGTSLRGDFKLKGEPRDLQPAVEENLLHIGQEALSNALKHACATKFLARLSFDSAAVCLELRDNGNGFVDRANGGGIGLVGMRERAEQIGATLQVISKPGTGTKIIAISPYQQPATK